MLIRYFRLFGSFKMFFIHTHYIFHGSHYFFEASASIVSQLIGAGRHILWQEAQVLHGFKHTTFFKVMVGEAGFCTAQTRVIGPGFTRLPVPEDTVTTCTGHRPAAAYFVEQATTSLTKVAIHFLGKADRIRASGLYKVGKESLGAVVFV